MYGCTREWHVLHDLNTISRHFRFIYNLKRLKKEIDNDLHKPRPYPWRIDNHIYLIVQLRHFRPFRHPPLFGSWGTLDSAVNPLTHLSLDKMAASLADDNFKCIFLYENDIIPIRISLKFVPRSPMDNMLALVQIMAWRRPGDKLIIWTNADPVHRRIYVALEGDELISWVLRDGGKIETTKTQNDLLYNSST